MVRTRILAVACAALLSACSPGERDAAEIADANAAKVALGKRIFFDTNLSSDGRTSCATCHKPELAFTDGLPRSKGVFGREGTRNAPSLIGVAGRSHLFWDGREISLSRAALQPFTNIREMGLTHENAVLTRLLAAPTYTALFKRAYNETHTAPTMDEVGDALAAYLTSVPTTASAYDLYLSGDLTALDSDQLDGLRLFRGKAGCGSCHHLDESDTLTDDLFHHVGAANKSINGRVADALSQLKAAPDMNEAILSDVNIAELGRFAITRRPSDLSAFRTPSLRNVALTAPYMHDGSVATLEEAVEQEIYYRALNRSNPPLLTVRERAMLVLFLESMSRR